MADLSELPDEGQYQARLALAAEVADEVRAVIAELSTRDVDEVRLAEALALARQLRDRLDGPRRPRWYEAGPLAAGELRSELLLDSYQTQSPFRGSINALAPPLTVETGARDDGTPVVRATALLGDAYEGPPHGVHGGFVAALFDDLLGAAQALVDQPGVTGRLTVHFRHLTPIHEQLRFEGWIDEQVGRRIIAKATCHAGDTLCAEAEGLFLQVDFEALQEKMQARKA
jgi:acyl-coenzyme A thioesterase PaaI-like protein